MLKNQSDKNIKETKRILSGNVLEMTFKNRVPDLGLCKVISIDWEEQSMHVNNGMICTIAGFDDVGLITLASDIK